MFCPERRRKPAGYPSLLLGAKKDRKTNEEHKNFSSPTSFAVILIAVPSVVDAGRLSTAMKVGGEEGGTTSAAPQGLADLVGGGVAERSDSRGDGGGSSAEQGKK